MNSLGLNSELFPFEVHFSFNDTLNFSLNMLEKMMMKELDSANARD